VDEELRGELVRRAQADSAAVQAFLDTAEDFRGEWTPESEAPWPYSLLEWTPVETAPDPVRHVLDVVRDNTGWLRVLVAERGWPGRSLVGQDGIDAAWLILQHTGSGVPTIGTPENLAFQATCVPLLRDAVRNGEADPWHLAHIVDNLHARAAEPAEYAVLNTAYVHHGDTVVLRPDLDPSTIDESRRQIGLHPIAEELRRRRG